MGKLLTVALGSLLALAAHAESSTWSADNSDTIAKILVKGSIIATNMGQSAAGAALTFVGLDAGWADESMQISQDLIVKSVEASANGFRVMLTKAEENALVARDSSQQRVEVSLQGAKDASQAMWMAIKEGGVAVGQTLVMVGKGSTDSGMTILVMAKEAALEMSEGAMVEASQILARIPVGAVQAAFATEEHNTGKWYFQNFAK